MYQELKEVWHELTAEGSPFHVTETEVQGNLIKTFSQAPPSLREVWLASLGHGDRDYLVYQDERWTYDQAHGEVASLAAWLHRNNVGQGKRVAIAMRNYPEWLIAYWATVSVGATVVGMNAWWIENEMAYALDDASPDVLIAGQERLDRFDNIRENFSDMTVIGVRLAQSRDYVIDWSDVISEDGELPDVSIQPDDDAVIFYTSGTTGNPKGAIQTHRGCVANVLNIAFWGTASAMATARANGEEIPENAQPADISALVTTPLFHVTANNCLAHAATVAGGKLVLMYKWDAGEALKMIERERITNLPGVPLMFRELISHPNLHKSDPSSLTSVAVGGAQVQPDLVSKIDSSVETARPGTGYGMTETCGIITTISADYFVDKPDSAGPAMPTFDVICVDPDGNELPQGEVGEICVQGAPVIKGYRNK
ncbi:MAG: acyl--CoA ligase, partial [Pseudomonadales bacterium]|nr:acyl--CoA ligase [Pseudomonadales bacterium]